MGLGGGYYPLSLKALGVIPLSPSPPPSYTPAWMADIETNSPSKIPLGKKFSKNHTYVIFGGENQAGKKGRKREREAKGGKENLNNHTA